MAKEANCVSFAIFSEKTTPVSFRKTHFLQFYAYLEIYIYGELHITIVLRFQEILSRLCNVKVQE